MSSRFRYIRLVALLIGWPTSIYFRVMWRWKNNNNREGIFQNNEKSSELILKHIRKAPNFSQTLKSAKSSSAKPFGQQPLLTLINDSLSLNFLGIFLSSSWMCVQRRKKFWPKYVKISFQIISATGKSPEGWPLTFWSKVRYVAPFFLLPLQYDVRSLNIENIYSYCTRIMVCLWDIMNLTFKLVTWNSMCVFVSCCRTKSNVYY